MGIRQRVKNLMDDLPFGADIYWQLRGKRKPWSAHYELEDLKAVLPQALADLSALRSRRADLPAGDASSSRALRGDLPGKQYHQRLSSSGGFFASFRMFPSLYARLPQKPAVL